MTLALLFVALAVVLVSVALWLDRPSERRDARRRNHARRVR